MRFTEQQITNREFNLDIIIPQYKETEEVIKPLLQSIEFQRGIDLSKIHVIIVNDHSDVKLSQEFLDSFTKLQIIYLETPTNKGPGHVRQFGLDYSSAEYILFADADDQFYSCDVFSEYFNVLIDNQEKDIDIIYAKWYEELYIKQAADPSFKDSIKIHAKIPHNTPDSTWVHGKLFRAAFLADKNIRHGDIRLHEDSYFNTLAQLCANTTATVDMYAYYWKYNEESLTRNEKYKYNYLVETCDDLIKSIELLAAELTKRKNPGRDEYIIKAILFTYFLLQADYWNVGLEEDEELQQKRRKFEFGIVKLLNTYNDAFAQCPYNKFLEFKNAERAQCLLNTGFQDERETWQAFIQRLNMTYPSYRRTCQECKFFNAETNSCEHTKDCTMTLDDYGIYSIPTHFEEAETTEAKTTTNKKKK